MLIAGLPSALNYSIFLAKNCLSLCILPRVSEFYALQAPRIESSVVIQVIFISLSAIEFSFFLLHRDHVYSDDMPTTHKERHPVVTGYVCPTPSCIHCKTPLQIRQFQHSSSNPIYNPRQGCCHTLPHRQMRFDTRRNCKGL